MRTRGAKSPDVKNNPLGVAIGQVFTNRDSHVLGVWRVENFTRFDIATFVIKHLTDLDLSG
jgi:hypothetical protein